MSILMQCPSCDKQLKAAEEKRGKKIRCPSCQEVFTVPAATKKSRPAAADDDEGFADKPMATRRRREEEDDELPRRSSRSRGREEEDDEVPRRTSRSRRDDDEDDYDDRPRPRSRQKKGSALPWILAGSGAGVLVLSGAVVAVVLASKKPAADQQAQAKAPVGNVAPVAQQQPPAGNPNQPAQPAPVQPAPVNPAQPAPAFQPPQAPVEGAPPQGWRLFAPKDRSFSVWLPNRGGRTGQSSRTMQRFGVALRINVVELSAPDGSVFQADDIILFGKAALGTPAQQRFELMRDIVVKQLNGTVTGEQPIQLGGAQGREYMISSAQRQGRVRVYSQGNRIYSAAIMGSAQQVQSDEANTFLNSYKLSAPPVASNPNPAQPNPAQPSPAQPQPQPRRPGKGLAVPPAAAGIKFSDDVFAFAQAAVRENRVAESKILGFTLNKDRYRSTLDDGAVLIGFEVGHGDLNDNVTVNGLRPIYLTKNGEKTGNWIGKIPASPTVIKAKAGYVVGSITVRSGIVLFGFSLNFVKLGKDSLEVSDNYNSNWVGGTRGQPETTGGQGALVVGIVGHLDDSRRRKDEPASIGLLLATAKQ